MEDPETNNNPLPILLLCLASFLLAAIFAWGVYESIPHLEDEHANLFQAKVFAHGELFNPAPPYPEAYFIPFVVNKDGKQFSKYTPGFSLLLAVGVLIQQAWLVNSLAAALGIYGTYLLGRDLFQHDTGLLAAALGAVSPMFILLSGTLLAHTANLALLVFFAWTFLRARRSGEAHRDVFALAAGGLIGWSLITRPWTALAVGLPFGILAISDLIRDPRQSLPVYTRMAILFVLVASLWLFYNQAATGSPFTNTYTLWWPYDSVGFGPQYGPNGYTWQKALINFKTSFPQFNQMLLGWPVVFGLPLAGLVTGLGIILPPHNRREMLLLVPALSLILAHFAYWAGSAGLYGPRYYSEGMPFLWILAARGLQKVWGLRFRAACFGRWLVRLGLPVCIVWGILFLTFPRSLEARGLYNITRYPTRVVADAHLRNALVFVKSSYWTQYANLSWANQPDKETGNIIYVRDLGEQTNLKVIQDHPGRSVYYLDCAQGKDCSLHQYINRVLIQGFPGLSQQIEPGQKQIGKAMQATAEAASRLEIPAKKQPHVK